MGVPLVNLNNVSKYYPKLLRAGDRLRALYSVFYAKSRQPHFPVLQDISLEVHQGESLGLVGVNGAGKSTLLKIIAGVIKPNGGSVQVNGRISAMLELGAGFHPEYTGRENIRLALSLAGLNGAEVTQRLPEIIEFADIGGYIEEPIKHYSSGMVVRLGFAVMTAVQPDILITDEVLAVGDESFQKKCISWMESYLSGGGTLLLCSHSMFHIQKLCRKACWIHEGRMRAYGDAFDVTREYLAYHEQKSIHDTTILKNSSTGYRVTDLWLKAGGESETAEIDMGSDLLIAGRLHSPDGRPPTVAIGLLRADGTPIYGLTSDIDGFVPKRLDAHSFEFNLRLYALPLLPGKYTLRTHAMDPEGLRVFDTMERAFSVIGRTRELGVCRLHHRWSSPSGELQ
jgi:lipopolysaccharide transport system ATP-binding protein